jgi:superfamily II DNA or RNA helicase
MTYDENDDQVMLQEWQDKNWLAVAAAAPVTDELEPLKNGPVDLRTFQTRVIRQIDEFFAQGRWIVSAEIYCAGGKTILAAMVALQFLRAGKKVAFVSPKRSAFEHFRKEFLRILVPEGFAPEAIHARHDMDLSLMPIDACVSIITPYDLVSPCASAGARRVLDGELEQVGLFILDEVHGMPGDAEDTTKIIGKVAPIVHKHAAATGAKVLTLTGTHYRGDKKAPLGLRKPDIMVTCKELIMEGCVPSLWGYAVPIRSEGLTKTSKNGDIIELKFPRRFLHIYHERVADGVMKAVEIEVAEAKRRSSIIGRELKSGGHAIFVCNQSEAMELCEILNKRLGWKAFIPYISDHVLANERLEVQEKLRDGRLMGYATVMMGVESINIPRIKYIHLVARICSPVKLMQAIGRGMRLPDDGSKEVKDKCVVIDYQVKKKRILRLAMGIHDIVRLGGGGPITKSGLLLGTRSVCSLPDDISVDLAQYEPWMQNTGELDMDADEKMQLLLSDMFPAGCPRPSVQIAKKMARVPKVT